MNRRRGVRVAVVAVIAITALVAVLAATKALWSPGQRGNQITQNRTSNQYIPNSSAANFSTSDQIANVSEAKTMINVVSSPSALPVVQRWVAQYNLEQNKATVNIAYSPDADNGISGANSSVSRFLFSNSADLGIVDGLQNGRASANSVILPASPHAVAIVYNIPAFPDIPSGLKLNRQALLNIITGNVTFWDDSTIKSLNPGLNLPHEKIVVVHTKDESSTYLLEQYLFSKNNSNKISWSQSSIEAPSVITLSSMVQQTPFSIGYIDYAYAVQTKMTYASLQNSAQKFVLPSTETISTAIQNGTRTGNVTGSSNVTTSNSSLLVDDSIPTVETAYDGNGSYPVVGLYFAAFVNSAANPGSSNSTATAVKDFARWMIGSEGQRIVQDAGYPSVYDSKLLKLYLAKKIG